MNATDGKNVGANSDLEGEERDGRDEVSKRAYLSIGEQLPDKDAVEDVVGKVTDVTAEVRRSRSRARRDTRASVV